MEAGAADGEEDNEQEERDEEDEVCDKGGGGVRSRRGAGGNWRRGRGDAALAAFFGDDAVAFLLEIALGEALAATVCSFIEDSELGRVVSIVSLDRSTKAGTTGFGLRGLSFTANKRNLRRGLRGLRGLTAAVLSPLREEKNRLCMLLVECVCRTVCNVVDYRQAARLCNNES